MIRRLLCLLGFHDYRLQCIEKLFIGPDRHPSRYRVVGLRKTFKCRCCGKQVFQIKYESKTARRQYLAGLNRRRFDGSGYLPIHDAICGSTVLRKL